MHIIVARSSHPCTQPGSHCHPRADPPPLRTAIQSKCQAPLPYKSTSTPSLSLNTPLKKASTFSAHASLAFFLPNTSRISPTGALLFSNGLCTKCAAPLYMLGACGDCTSWYSGEGRPRVVHRSFGERLEKGVLEKGGGEETAEWGEWQWGGRRRGRVRHTDHPRHETDFLPLPTNPRTTLGGTLAALGRNNRHPHAALPLLPLPAIAVVHVAALRRATHVPVLDQPQHRLPRRVRLRRFLVREGQCAGAEGCVRPSRDRAFAREVCA